MKHGAPCRSKSGPLRGSSLPVPVALSGPRERSPAVFLCVLALALLADAPPPLSQALSGELSARRAPSLLQQFASFAALRAVAEERELDWGAPTAFGAEKTFALRLRPGEEDAPPPASLPLSSSSCASSETRSSPSLTSLTSLTSSSASASPATLPCAATVSVAHSRRRPHRRQRAKAKRDAESDDATRSSETNERGDGESSKEMNERVDGESSKETNEKVNESPVNVWSQLHVMDIARRTGDRDFVDQTDHFVHREHMYPIVYRCNLRDVTVANEKELIRAPTTGLDASRFWSCRTCGKAHDAVRELCLRCRRPGPYTKLFVGQVLKETNCAKSVLRLLRATHPDIAVHRIESHEHKCGNRGRGCASVYVYPDAAEELKAKLNNNVFFDVDDHTRVAVKDAVFVYYVYATQRRWLQSLVAFRTERGQDRSMKGRSLLPWRTLVVQDSAEPHKHKK